MRIPRVSRLEDSTAAAPIIADAAERWRAPRVDVAAGTAVGHGVQLADRA